MRQKRLRTESHTKQPASIFNQENSFVNFPDLVLIAIFSYLPPENAAFICKKLQGLFFTVNFEWEGMQSNEIWKIWTYQLAALSIPNLSSSIDSKLLPPALMPDVVANRVFNTNAVHVLSLQKAVAHLHDFYQSTLNLDVVQIQELQNLFEQVPLKVYAVLLEIRFKEEFSKLPQYQLLLNTSWTLICALYAAIRQKIECCNEANMADREKRFAWIKAYQAIRELNTAVLLSCLNHFKSMSDAFEMQQWLRLLKQDNNHRKVTLLSMDRKLTISLNVAVPRLLNRVNELSGPNNSELRKSLRNEIRSELFPILPLPIAALVLQMTLSLTQNDRNLLLINVARAESFPLVSYQTIIKLCSNIRLWDFDTPRGQKQLANLREVLQHFPISVFSSCQTGSALSHFLLQKNEMASTYIKKIIFLCSIPKIRQSFSQCRMARKVINLASSRLKDSIATLLLSHLNIEHFIQNEKWKSWFKRMILQFSYAWCTEQQVQQLRRHLSWSERRELLVNLQDEHDYQFSADMLWPELHEDFTVAQRCVLAFHLHDDDGLFTFLYELRDHQGLLLQTLHEVCDENQFLLLHYVFQTRVAIQVLDLLYPDALLSLQLNAQSSQQFTPLFCAVTNQPPTYLHILFMYIASNQNFYLGLFTTGGYGYSAESLMRKYLSADIYNEFDQSYGFTHHRFFNKPNNAADTEDDLDPNLIREPWANQFL